MSKLSPAMERALGKLINVADYTNNVESINDGWRPALVCLRAREATFDALVRRGLAEMKVSHIRGFPSLPMKKYRLIVSPESCELVNQKILDG